MKAHIPRQPSARDRRELKARQSIISTSMDCYMMIAMLALNDKFGFGQERLDRFVKAWQETAAEYADRYDDAVYDALRIKLRDRLGIEFISK